MHKALDIALILSFLLASSCGKIDSDQQMSEDERNNWNQDGVESIVSPVMSVSVPSMVTSREPLDIQGTGFSKEGMEIYFRGPDESTQTKAEFDLTASGIRCTVPEGLSSGTYSIVLHVIADDSWWVLSRSLNLTVIQKQGRLSSIQLKEMTEYEIDAVDASTMEELAASNGMSVEEFKQALKKAGYETKESTTRMTFSYDDEGYMTSIKGSIFSGIEDSPIYTMSWEDDHKTLKVTNDRFESGYDMVKSYTFNIEDGRAVYILEETENREMDYDLEYDSYGSLTTEKKWTGAIYASFSFNARHSFTGVGRQTFFRYSSPYTPVSSTGIDVPVAVLDIIYHYGFSGQDTEWMPLLNTLRLSGMPSAYVPSSLYDPQTRKWFDMEYTWAGYADEGDPDVVESVSWSASGTDSLYEVIPVKSSNIVTFTY